MRTSSNFAHLASFQAIEFVNWPVPKELDIIFCMSDKQRQKFLYKRQLSAVREEREHELISSPVSTLSTRTLALCPP